MTEADGWRGLELRHLAALQAVARAGSFAAAATSLGYTQSAISQQIAALERTIGARVVERPGGRRPAVLTDVGRRLVEHADAIVARLHAARADVAALAGGDAGALAIGAYQSVGTRILPTLLREFRDAWPGVEIRLREAPGDRELLDAVEAGELDLTFAMLPTGPGPFESVPLLRDPYVLVVEAGSPLVQLDGPVPLSALAGLPLIGFRSCRNEQRVEAQLRARGLEPRVVFRSDDNGTVQSLVAAGIGAALVPRLTMDPRDERTALREVGGRLPPRILGLAWHRDRHRSAAAVAFVDAAQRVFADAKRGDPVATPIHGDYAERGDLID